MWMCFVLRWRLALHMARTLQSVLNVGSYSTDRYAHDRAGVGAPRKGIDLLDHLTHLAS